VDHGWEAYKSVLSDLIYKYNEGVLGAVDRMAPHRNLVMSLLTNVTAQWNEMCSFIDSIYRIDKRGRLQRQQSLEACW
jgi:hypothetical protein